MIISIRGTSGSGKSTIVRKVMAAYQYCQPTYVEGRKQPLFYHLSGGIALPKPLIVIGHYESPCGGCDTIHEFDHIFEIVEHSAKVDWNVLFEGVLLYCEIPRTVKLAEQFRTLILALNTPIDVCLESVNQRRRDKNPLKDDVDPANTITKFNGTISTMNKLILEGVEVEWASRESALERCLKEFGLNPGFALL